MDVAHALAAACSFGRIVCGFTMIFLGIIQLQWNSWAALIAAGIWCGIFSIVGGLLGLVDTFYRCIEISNAFMVYSISTLILPFGLAVLSAAAFIQDHACLYPDDINLIEQTDTASSTISSIGDVNKLTGNSSDLPTVDAHSAWRFISVHTNVRKRSILLPLEEVYLSQNASTWNWNDTTSTFSPTTLTTTTTDTPFEHADNLSLDLLNCPTTDTVLSIDSVLAVFGVIDFLVAIGLISIGLIQACRFRRIEGETWDGLTTMSPTTASGLTLAQQNARSMAPTVSIIVSNRPTNQAAEANEEGRRHNRNIMRTGPAHAPMILPTVETVGETFPADTAPIRPMLTQ